VTGEPFLADSGGTWIYAQDYTSMPKHFVEANILHCHSSCPSARKAYLNVMDIKGGQLQTIGSRLPVICAHTATFEAMISQIKKFDTYFPKASTLKPKC